MHSAIIYRYKVSKIQALDKFRNSQIPKRLEKGWKSSPLVADITYRFIWWGLFLWFKQVVCYFLLYPSWFSILSCIFCVSSVNISSLLSQYMFQTLSTFVTSGNPFTSAVGAHSQTPVPAPQALPEGQQKSWERDEFCSTAKHVAIAAPSSSPWDHLQPTEPQMPFTQPQGHREPRLTVTTGSKWSNLYRGTCTCFKQFLIAQNTF